MTENQINVLNSQKRFRSDHYNGSNGIFGFVGYLDDLPFCLWDENLEEEIGKVVKEFSKLDVPPNRIDLYSDSMQIYWLPKYDQIVSTLGQYTGLMLEFGKFLDECPIKGLSIYSTTFEDDPKYLPRSIDANPRNYFPEFNSKYFGSYLGNPIRVHNMEYFAEEVNYK